MKLDLTKISFEDFDTLRQNGFITDFEMEAAKVASGSEFKYNFWDITIEELGVILDGKLPQRIIDLFNIEGISAAEFLKRNNAFEQFIKDFCTIFGKLNVPETADEKKASVGIPVFTHYEGMLIFAQEFFHLHNFTEAGNITLGDLYLAKKRWYASKLYERNYTSIIHRKHSKK